MATVQYLEGHGSTDAHGYLFFDFPRRIDHAMATVSAPQDRAFSATVQVVSGTQVRVRVWARHRLVVGPLARTKVTVTVAGITN